eukprot:Hpha_TRINITY_DN16038_c5_g1::TRINITY_DN16038_c5_g1_i1::g.117411::m.117411
MADGTCRPVRIVSESDAPQPPDEFTSLDIPVRARSMQEFMAEPTETWDAPPRAPPPPEEELVAPLPKAGAEQMQRAMSLDEADPAPLQPMGRSASEPLQRKRTLILDPDADQPPAEAAEAVEVGGGARVSGESLPSWVTSSSQDAHVEVHPYPSDARYAGRAETSTACVALGDRVLYASDAAGKLELCARKLANQGRRGRRVPQLRNEPVALEKVIIKRKRRTDAPEEDVEEPPRAARRLEVTFEVHNNFSGSVRTQLAHAFRESVGPLRKNIRVDVHRVGEEEPAAEVAQCPPQMG